MQDSIGLGLEDPWELFRAWEFFLQSKSWKIIKSLSKYYGDIAYS